MARVDEVRLLPDPDQRKALEATLERVNRTSNAVRAAGLEARVFEGPALRDLVRAELERAKLPAAFSAPILERVQASLARRAGKQPRFSAYQALTFAPSALKWPASERVTIPTAAGRRTVQVRVDRSRGDLRPPLEGRPVSLVFRNGEFDLVAADVEHEED